MSTNGTQPIPYWNVNIAKEQWTETCPSFLADIPEGDRTVLSIGDEDYHRISWDEVREVIRTNRLELFNRLPTDLRRYREYIFQIKASHGSVMQYILEERVQWNDITPKAAPFENADDLKILFNDWPYGIDTNIVHLVVWTKFNLEEDKTTGDLTPKAREEIDEYVQATFCTTEKPDHVIWFKNWAALKSVHAVEHFHIMLYDPDPAFIKRITNGDVSMAEKLACR